MKSGARWISGLRSHRKCDGNDRYRDVSETCPCFLFFPCQKLVTGHKHENTPLGNTHNMQTNRCVHFSTSLYTTYIQLNIYKAPLHQDQRAEKSKTNGTVNTTNYIWYKWVLRDFLNKGKKLQFLMRTGRLFNIRGSMRVKTSQCKFCFCYKILLWSGSVDYQQILMVRNPHQALTMFS